MIILRTFNDYAYKPHEAIHIEALGYETQTTIIR